MQKKILPISIAIVGCTLFWLVIAPDSVSLLGAKHSSNNQQLSLEGLSAVEASRMVLNQMMEEEGIVGLSVAVSINDTIVWSEGLGYRDLQQKKAISPSETYFRIASISKPFTATILGRLYEEGVVDFNESLYRYVPDFPSKKYDFTLRQLAQHRAGIRHYHKFEGENTAPLTIEEGLVKFKNDRLRFKPGTEYNYSSYGYNLLGVALEKASQKSFADLLEEYVNQPLSLQHIVPDNGDYASLNTSGFFKINRWGKVKAEKDYNFTMKLPCGGLLATAEDLVRFGNAYAYGRILDPATQRILLTDERLPNGETIGYGMGWGISTDREGRRNISHTGGQAGSICRLIVYPEQKLTVTVLMNTFGADYFKFLRNFSNISEAFLAEIEK